MLVIVAFMARLTYTTQQTHFQKQIVVIPEEDEWVEIVFFSTANVLFNTVFSFQIQEVSPPKSSCGDFSGGQYPPSLGGLLHCQPPNMVRGEVRKNEQKTKIRKTKTI